MNRQELFASLVFEWQVVVVVWLSSWTEMAEIYWRKDVETGKVCKQEVWQKKKMIKEYGRMVLAFLAHMEGFTVGPKGIEEGTSKTKAANSASFWMLSHQPFSFFTISPLLHTDNHWSNPSILYQLGSASDNWGLQDL